AFLASTGCSTVRELVSVRKPAPRVTLKGYALDLAYGEEPPGPGQAPAALAPTLNQLASQAFDFPLYTPNTIAARRPGAPPSTRVDPCPPAPASAAAERPVTADVPAGTVVVPGVYLWKQAGSVRILPLNIDVPLPPLTARIVRNLATQGTTMSFDVELATGLCRQI